MKAYNEFQTETQSYGYFIIIPTDSEMVITSLENTDHYLQKGQKVSRGVIEDYHVRIQRGGRPPEKSLKYSVSLQYWSGSPENH